MRYLVFLAIGLLFFGCKKEDEYINMENLTHEDIELDNTTWVIHKSYEIPVRSTTNGRLPTLHFKDGGMGVGTNCNHAFSEYQIDGNTIKFRGLFTTYKYCPDMEIEAYFGTNIRSINSYIFSEGKLYLFIDKKMIGSFKRIAN